jgi:site-specific DNA-methyltransferase (adenine-specific)
MKLYKGDCLEVMDRMIAEGVKVDAIITDPPYGTTQCKWDSVIPFKPMWDQLNRIIKPNGAIVLFGSEPFSSALRMSNIKNYKYDWVWEKSKATNFLNAKKQPLRAKENILVFYKKQPTYNPQMTKGKSYNKGIRKKQTKDDVYGSFNQTEVKSEGNRYPRDVLYFKTAETEGKTFHKTQKPVKLMEYLIKTYTNENETVLDFTLGSGTTGVACVNTNRNFIGIELDETYFNIAEERIEKHTKQGRLFTGEIK